MTRLSGLITPVRARFPTAYARVYHVLVEDVHACCDERLRAQDGRTIHVALVPIGDAYGTVARRERVGASIWYPCLFPDGIAACR